MAEDPDVVRKRASEMLEKARRDLDPDEMTHAALELLHDGAAYDDAAKVLDELARTYPDRRADATALTGDANLFAALRDPAGPRPEHVPRLEKAISCYESAMRFGKLPSHVEDHYWKAASALAFVHPSPVRRRGAVDVYRRTFPNGSHVAEADALLKRLASG